MTTKTIEKEKALKSYEQAKKEGRLIKETKGNMREEVYLYLEHNFTFFFFKNELKKIETYNGVFLNEIYVI